MRNTPYCEIRRVLTRTRTDAQAINNSDNNEVRDRDFHVFPCSIFGIRENSRVFRGTIDKSSNGLSLSFISIKQTGT